MQQFKIPITVLALALLACYLVAPHLQKGPTGTLYTSNSEGITESPLDARSRIYHDYAAIGSDSVAATDPEPSRDGHCWLVVILFAVCCFIAYMWTDKKQTGETNGRTTEED